MDVFKFIKSKVSFDKLPYEEVSAAEDTLLEKSRPGPQRHAQQLSAIFPFLFHGFVFTIYTVVFMFSLRHMREERRHGPDFIHTPARSSIEYQAQIFSVPLEFNSPYVGEPRKELDNAWHDLLQYTNIRISRDEMKRLGRLEEGIELPGGGYFGSLMVYHQLHCIKRLHHYTYADHYFPNMTKEENRNNRLHTTHCLDILRQSIQCQGDATLLTMRWGKKQPIPIGNFTGAHECVNWNMLHNWSKERSVDMFAPGVFVHPTLGPSFPGGKTERIGVAEDE